MPDIVVYLIASFVCYLAFAFFALAMKRHWRQVARDAGPPRSLAVSMRVLGVLALIAGLVLVLRSDGVAFGTTLWAVMVSAAAMAIVATLTWRPHWLRPITQLARIPYR